ncbi:unnamed protein product [Scytosiphon promiscuus]
MALSAEPKNVAAVHAQRVVRGFLGRLAAIRQANLVYEKIFDPRTHAYYYYNTYSFETTWQPPTVVTRILGEFGDLDTVAPTYTEEEAAVMLQAAWRRRRGVRLTRALLASVVTKVLDESTGAFYYFNSLTGETSWSKPALFGTEDVESYPREMMAAEDKDGRDPFDTDNYSYDQSQGWDAQQQDYNTGNAVGAIAAEESGHEGWVWDDTSGWYFDEDLARQVSSSGKDGPGSNDGNSAISEDDGSDGESASDSNSESSEDIGTATEYTAGEGGEEDARRKKRRRKRRRRSLAPRKYPRSKAQRLVDEAEDSIDGARPDSLNLSELNMDRVTSRIYRMDWLTKLDLSNNRLYRISPDLAGMESLVDVNLRQNRIKSIPDDLEALTNLKHLRLGHNRISGFRGNVYLISSLETLDLGHNRLKEVPLQVGDLQLLKRTREWEIGLRLLRGLISLDVSYNRLKEWPPQVEGCKKLRDLRLDHNRLQEVPDVVGDNTALTSLNLSSNSFKSIPDTINSLTDLTRLELSDNKISILPIFPIGRKGKGPRLASLEILKLERNRLTEGPAAVETFKTLTELDVSNNPIEGWNLDVSNLRKMKRLRLKGVHLHQCPEGIGLLNKLESLDLSANRIGTLDQSMAALFKLTFLDLRDNNITDLGACLGSMVSLTYLDAGGNNLELISPELSRCTALDYLDVGSGTIDHLPEAFSKLTRLRILRAHDNELKTIPPEFKALALLEQLYLSGNRLSGLPTSLSTLQKMRFADFSRNMMESPPSVTREWPLLTHLVLSRNPLRGRRHQSLRLLQAAQKGHDAMHRGDWQEAVRLLEIAADAYDRAIHTVADFPDPAGEGEHEGPPIAKARPHDMVTFHHVNLGMAHLQGARQAVAKVEDLEKEEAPTGGSIAESVSMESLQATEDSSLISMTNSEREARRRKELELCFLRKKKKQHHEAAKVAFTYADHLEQLSRPVGRSAGVWLGRAAVSADMGNHAAALDDLELALVQLRKNAKIRALLAKSRIELGQYERGLTDCAVASRLLDFEERLLGEREAAQVPSFCRWRSGGVKSRKQRTKSGKAARWTLKASDLGLPPIRDSSFAHGGSGEGQRSSRASLESGVDSQDGGKENKSTTSEDVNKPTTVATGKDLKVAVDVEDKGGDEEVGAIPEVHTEAAGVASGGLSAIKEEELPPPKMLRGDAVVGNQTDAYEKGDGDESHLGRAERSIDHVVDGRTEEGPAEPNVGTIELTQRQEQSLPLPQGNGFPFQSEDVLKKIRSQPEESKARQSQLKLPAESAAAGTDASGGRDGKETAEASPARLELAKQRADIAVLTAEAKEGMAFVSRSVDMADVLRGFEFTRYGVPVRDPTVKEELLREGRSTLRDRHRKLMAVQAAKKRGRASDVRLMERAFRQVTARQTSGRATKARKAAAMAMYRDIEEAWERMQEEKESTKRIEAAKRKLEHQVLVRTW